MGTLKNQNEFDIRSMALQGYLRQAELQVLPTLPNPFGSFEKAKYEIRCDTVCKTPKNPYSFVTTCHNTEDAFSILKNMRGIFKPYCVITKTVNGVKEILYRTPRYRP